MNVPLPSVQEWYKMFLFFFLNLNLMFYLIWCKIQRNITYQILLSSPKIYEKGNFEFILTEGVKENYRLIKTFCLFYLKN